MIFIGEGTINRTKRLILKYLRMIAMIGQNYGNHRWIISVTEGFKNELWIATHGGGLNKFDTRTQKFTHYTKKQFNPYGLKNNDLKRVYVDPLKQTTYQIEMKAVDL